MIRRTFWAVRDWRGELGSTRQDTAGVERRRSATGRRAPTTPRKHESPDPSRYATCTYSGRRSSSRSRRGDECGPNRSAAVGADQRRIGPFGAIEPPASPTRPFAPRVFLLIQRGLADNGCVMEDPSVGCNGCSQGSADSRWDVRWTRQLVRGSDPGQGLTTEETRISPGRSLRGRRCRGTGGTARPRRVSGPRPLRESRCWRRQRCRARCPRRG